MGKLIVFGATGGTGMAALRLALMQGWEVTAFVRNPKKLEMPQGSSIRVIQGDVMNAESVAAAVDGQDGVLVSLGGGIGQLISRCAVCSEGTKNIILGMKKAGVKRIVIISSMGAGKSAEHVNRFYKWILKYPLEDKNVQEAIVMESGLDFVIVRPTGLTNGPPSAGTIVVDSDNEAVPFNQVSRNDVALFALDQFTSSEYLKKSPGICSGKAVP
jgi:uncharacterized protein YbjT (DUF2867 family)